MIKRLKGFFVAILANFLLIAIAVLKKSNTRVLIICYPLGDTCYGLAFSKYLQDIGRCIYIICKNQKRLVEECYPHINNKDVYYYKKKGLSYRLVIYCSFSYYINRFYGRYNIYATIPYAYYKQKDYIQESYLAYLRRILKINNNISSIRPYFCVSHDIAQSNNIVILNPYSNSMSIDNIEYWEFVEKYLSQNGFIVYTNVMKDQQPIGNSIRLDCDIFELYRLVDNNRALVISIRSGIIDFLIGSKGRFFVVYYMSENMLSKSLRNFCDLTKWEQGVDNVDEVESSDLTLKEKTLNFIKSN